MECNQQAAAVHSRVEQVVAVDCEQQENCFTESVKPGDLSTKAYAGSCTIDPAMHAWTCDTMSAQGLCLPHTLPANHRRSASIIYNLDAAESQDQLLLCQIL